MIEGLTWRMEPSRLRSHLRLWGRVACALLLVMWVLLQFA